MSHGHEHGNVAISNKAFELYGVISLSLDHNNPGAGGDSNVYLESGGTVLGVKGGSPINEDLKLFWQIESTIDLTELGTANKSQWAGHDSFVGVASKYGTLLAGKHHTPYTMTTLALDPFHHLAGDMRLLLGNINDLNSGAGDHHGSAFNVRAPDVVMYQTPQKNGFSANFAVFGFNERKKAVPTGDTSAFSIGASYDVGPLLATAAYELHKNYDSYGDHHGATDPEVIDKTAAAKLGLMYGFSKVVVGVVYENIKVSDASIAVPNASRDTYYLSAKAPLGENTALKLAYGNGSEFAGDDKASFYALGLFRDLSKIAQAYVSYIHTSNDAQARFGTFRVTPVEEGGDPSTLSTGIVYAF